MIDPKLFEILCCPLGKADLKIEGDTLVCTKCNVIFPVEDGIPILLIEDAKLPDGVADISDLKCQKEIKHG